MCVFIECTITKWTELSKSPLTTHGMLCSGLGGAPCLGPRSHARGARRRESRGTPPRRGATAMLLVSQLAPLRLVILRLALLVSGTGPGAAGGCGVPVERRRLRGRGSRAAQVAIALHAHQGDVEQIELVTVSVVE